MKFKKSTLVALYVLLEMLGGYVGFFTGDSVRAYAQTQYGPVFTQTFTISTVAPPANTPLLGSGLNCTGTAGSFSASTLVIAYTYTGTDSSSESKASTDGGSTLTTLVTCPTNGTLVIPSPPVPAGCANCVGWRPYAVASSSGTGAELLQTIASTNCPLAATSSLTACQIGQPFVETSLGAGAAIPTNPSLFTMGNQGLVATNPLTEVSLTGNHTLYWTITGTAASCTLTLQTATTQSGSYSTMTGTSAQTCTSSGVFQIVGEPANFVRLAAPTFTATTTNTPSITVTLVSTTAPIASGAILSCGSTGTGNQTCAPANGKFPQTIVGESTLSANAAIITFVPGFTSTTSFFCVANDVTTRANVVQMVPSAANTATITNTTGGSDVIQWICTGN